MTASRPAIATAAAAPIQICTWETVTTNVSARASGIGSSGNGGSQCSRTPWNSRRNSWIDNATAIVATRIGWPRRCVLCSGAITVRPMNQLHNPDSDTASIKASAKPPNGLCKPTVSAAATPPIAP